MHLLRAARGLPQVGGVVTRGLAHVHERLHGLPASLRLQVQLTRHAIDERLPLLELLVQPLEAFLRLLDGRVVVHLRVEGVVEDAVVVRQFLGESSDGACRVLCVGRLPRQRFRIVGDDFRAVLHREVDQVQLLLMRVERSVDEAEASRLLEQRVPVCGHRVEERH
ncbi:hypothetical protein ACFPRL_31985 [Pseudoclavibacter helvolus]